MINRQYLACPADNTNTESPRNRKGSVADPTTRPLIDQNDNNSQSHND